MANFICAAGKSGELFGETPANGHKRQVKRRSTPELIAARVLCRELRRKRASPDKKRIAHLICLNLLTMLRHDAPGFAR